MQIVTRPLAVWLCLLLGRLVFSYGNVISFRAFYCREPRKSCLYCCNCDLSDSCTGDCQDGYHGSLCRNKCPDNCVRCKDHSNTAGYPGYANCTKCKVGYYLTEDLYQCQLPCPSGCRSCLSDSDCMACNHGYYGETCSATCPKNCADGQCNFNTGHCMACNHGFYGETCNAICPKNCADGQCNFNTGHCMACNHGYYGEICNVTCPESCADGQCYSTTGHCMACNHGFYGETCNAFCPENCDSGRCNMTSDDCLSCEERYNGLKCERCVTGQYGEVCNISCPVACLDLVCDQVSGLCSRGCTPYFDGSNCLDCQLGYHGEECSLQCPPGCKDGLCSRMSVACFKCSETFAGKNCQYCIQGFYGLDCKLFCSENCTYGVCSRDTGSCLSCIHSGLYGSFCEQQCPEYCINSTCDRWTGICDHGCNMSYQPEKGSQCGSTTEMQSKATSEIWFPLAISGILAWSILIIVGIGAVLCLWYRRRRRIKGRNVDCTPLEERSNVTNLEPIDDKHYESLSASRDSGTTYTTLC